MPALLLGAAAAARAGVGAVLAAPVQTTSQRSVNGIRHQDTVQPCNNTVSYTAAAVMDAITNINYALVQHSLQSSLVPE
jgi:hypothetical protein